MRFDIEKLPVLDGLVHPTPKPTEMACRNCAFYDPTEQLYDDEAVIHYDQYEGQGECRRYPPVFAKSFTHPIVHETEWCGEFKAR